MSEVFIISTCRTPIGKIVSFIKYNNYNLCYFIGNFQGQFEKYSAVELGTIVIEEAIKRANISPVDIEHVIIGQVMKIYFLQIWDLSYLLFSICDHSSTKIN